MAKQYVQYGCGLCAPQSWINFDASPTLRLQKTPFVNVLVKKRLNVVFPSNVLYGDIVKGLPGVAESSCDGVFCSHTLEHLSLNDFRTALQNTYRMLKAGGLFRCIVPDLEYSARKYVQALNEGAEDASTQFMKETLLGVEKRAKGITAFLTSSFGNAHHLWMWDFRSLASELKKIGFKDIRLCSFNDSADIMFNSVEDKGRFNEAVAIECRK